MTSADVKFSIDEASKDQAAAGSSSTPRSRTSTAPDPNTVVITTKYPWAPLLADLALFNNGICPRTTPARPEAILRAPIGTGPFMWDHWTQGQELKLVRTRTTGRRASRIWTASPGRRSADDNTRELQLKGGQAQIDEFPPFSSSTAARARRA